MAFNNQYQVPLVLIGGTGCLGRAILSVDSSVIAPSKTEVDVVNFQSVIETLKLIKPKIIILSAALVGKLECDSQPKLARKINILGVRNVAYACRELSAKLIFISSCAVFDGKKGNYSEDDIPNPQYLYAETKFEAECILSGILSEYLIIRTDFFDPYKFKYKRVLEDHFCSKEPAPIIAKKIIMAIETGAKGILHIGGPKNSLYEIIKPFFPSIKPIKTIDSQIPDFPKDLSLSTKKYEQIIAQSKT